MRSKTRVRPNYYCWTIRNDDDVFMTGDQRKVIMKLSAHGLLHMYMRTGFQIGSRQQ